MVAIPIRSNFQQGTLASSHDSTNTIISFGAAPGFPTLAADQFVPITLLNAANPDDSEIVYMTAYTAGNTTGNITRGQEGQASTTWAQGATWEHAPTARDLFGSPVFITGNTGGTTTPGTTGQFWLAGGNNITMSRSTAGAGGDTISIVGPTQTNQTVGAYGSGNTSGTSSGTLDARSLTVHAQGGLTVDMTNGKLNISGITSAAQTNQTVGVYGSSQTVGESSSSTIDARSLTVFAKGAISAGMSAGKLLLSVPDVVAQSNQTLGVYGSSNTSGTSTGTLDARSLTVVARGGLSVDMTNGIINLSGITSTPQTVQTVGVYGGGNTSGTSSGTLDARSLSISVQGSLTVDMTNGLINLSAPNALTTAMASNRGSDFVAATAGFNGTNASGTIASNAWSVSVAAQTNQTVGASISGNSSGTASGTFDARSMTLSLAGGITGDMTNGRLNLSVVNTVAQTNQSLGIYASSATVGQSSSSTYDARSLTIVGSGGGLSVGWSNGSLILDASTALNAAQTNQTLGIYGSSNTSGASSATIDARSLTFQAAGNLSVNMTNGKVAYSVPARTKAIWDNAPWGNTVSGGMGSVAFTASHRSLFVIPLTPDNLFPADMTANTLMFNMSLSGSANTNSVAYTSHLYVGVYTLNASTLSLLNSALVSHGSGANNANLSNINHHQRFLPIVSSAWSVEPVFREGSEYWVAWFWSSAGAMNQTGNMLGHFRYSTLQRSGSIGVSQTTGVTQGWNPYYGVYTATTNALPNSIQVAHMNKISANVGFIPHIVINQAALASF